MLLVLLLVLLVLLVFLLLLVLQLLLLLLMLFAVAAGVAGVAAAAAVVAVQQLCSSNTPCARFLQAREETAGLCAVPLPPALLAEVGALAAAHLGLPADDAPPRLQLEAETFVEFAYIDGRDFSRCVAHAWPQVRQRSAASVQRLDHTLSQIPQKISHELCSLAAAVIQARV